MDAKVWIETGEYMAAGLYEETDRSLFYRKALGIRRFYENCPLPEYHGEKLYPSGVLPTGMDIRPHYLHGMEIKPDSKIDLKMIDELKGEFFRYQSSVPADHTVAGNMWTHSMPNYERILKEGFASYGERIAKIEDADMREGLSHILAGIQNYIHRSVAYLNQIGAEKSLIDALGKVPFAPAENLYEAIVGWNFILYLDNCDNLGCVAAGLLPYYRGEDVTDLLRNLYDNLDANGGYSMALGIDYNPLTLQCLEASKGKRRPMIELFVNEDTPDEIWEKAFEVIRTNNGQPAFYHEKGFMTGLRQKFPTIPEEDLKKFCGGGCTETMLAGLSNVGSLDAGIHLPLILEKVIKENLTKANSFEEFYRIYIEEVEKVVEIVTEEIGNSRRNRAKYSPLPMRTLLIDDCIDKGEEYNNGGARYNWSIISFAGMVNVIDAMLVLRDFVFTEKRFTKEEVLQKLAANDEEFLAQARNHKVSFGNDNPDANEFGKRISTEIYSMLDHKKPPMGEAFLPASIMFMAQVSSGLKVGATPDGRKAQAPLADSLGAIFGKDVEGPTALLKSVTSLNLERALGTPVLNFNITPDFKNETLKSLILGYLKLGGMQMQISCTSKELLKEAYENPDLHKNLIVRVGGYSEYFYRLSDGLKKMILERSIQESV